MHSSSSAVTRHLFCAVSIGGCLWKLAVCNHGNDIFQAMSLNMLNWFSCYHQICWYSESYSSNPNNWKIAFTLSFFAVWAHSCTAHCLSFVGPLRPFAAPGFASTTGMTNFMEVFNINTKRKITRRDTLISDHLWSNTYPDRVKALPWKHEWIKSPHGPSPLEPRMRNQMGHSIENTFMMYPLRDLKLSNWQWYIPNDSYLRWLVSLS